MTQILKVEMGILCKMLWLPLCLMILSSLTDAWQFNSEEEFAQAMLAGELAVVTYVHAQSAKSRALEPEWAPLVQQSSVKLIAVNCERSHNTCSATGESIVAFDSGNELSRYHGSRHTAALLSWIQRIQGPVLTELDEKSIEAFKNADEVVFIAYLNGEDEATKAAFAQVATKFSAEFRFGITTDSSVIEKENVEIPLIRCFKPLDGDTHETNDVADLVALEKFVVESSRLVIAELTRYNQQRLLDRGWPMVYIFAAMVAERSALRESLRGMARSYYKSLTMVTVDPLEFLDLQEKLGLEPGTFPAGAVHQLSSDRIYPYPKGRDITPRQLQRWGLEVYQGRVKPWTPPGVTATYNNIGGGIKATQKVSINIPNIPGVNIRVGGRDEL
ncbi:hypothetical protein GGR57DRAFT_31687 [Xylariaceae sp. FL1272]|nr:hypothetical protein GGR57DRAFT_31687 [Xylariaceae sp. FL1272]